MYLSSVGIEIVNDNNYNGIVLMVLNCKKEEIEERYREITGEIL